MRLFKIERTGIKVRVKYLSLIRCMAEIDGHLSEEEKNLLKKMIVKFQIPEKYYPSVFQPASFSDEEIETLFHELCAKHMEYSFFMDLIAMSVVDGVVMDSERKMLSQILELTDITLAEFHNLINFAQITSQITDTGMINSMYMPAITMVFDWAKRNKIRFFQQTTFAISDQVDAILKEEYIHT